MPTLYRIRLYHAVLAGLSMLAYLTGEAGAVHTWLGYGVAVAILFRLAWAIGGERQLGLQKFYPRFEGMTVNNALVHPAISKTFLLAIAVALIGVTVTGIQLDRGEAVGLAAAPLVALAVADDEAGEEAAEDDDRGDGRNENEGGEWVEDLHELPANLLVLAVGLHVSYLLLFKRPLARFMLFLPKAGPKNPAS